MHLKYDLHDAGWASATFTDSSGESTLMDVSYLHDTLGNLADAALKLARGSKKEVVVFMAEPGEHQLLLTQSNCSLKYTLTWHSDWTSLNITGATPPKVEAAGQVDLLDFTRNIYDICHCIFTQFGEAGYKMKWLEHDFPMIQYNELSENV